MFQMFAADKESAMDAGICNQMGSPGTSVMTLSPPAMQGPPGPPIPPMQPPPGMPNPHVPPYLTSPNMQHMPPQMMPDGPVFPPNRFRMRMPFPPRGPPFQSCPPVGPEGIGDREGPFFRGVRPGFHIPPFQRGRWWWTLMFLLHLPVFTFVHICIFKLNQFVADIHKGRVYMCVFLIRLLIWILKKKINCKLIFIWPHFLPETLDLIWRSNVLPVEGRVVLMPVFFSQSSCKQRSHLER